MKFLRKLFYRVFGLKAYLRFVSIAYIRLVKAGFFRQKYPELFFLKKLIQSHQVCIDIGANLGYYTTFLSRLVGEKGKVYAVEPVPLFREILQHNIRKTHAKNVEVFPYALGEEEKEIKMGMPEKGGIIHHGMTKVADTEEEIFVEYFQAKMKIPDELFASIPAIHFIKCDVEGYEHYVFQNMQKTIKKNTPVVQSELSGKENRMAVYSIFSKMNYDCFQLVNNKLMAVSKEKLFEKDSDFYFLPKKSTDTLSN